MGDPEWRQRNLTIPSPYRPAEPRPWDGRGVAYFNPVFGIEGVQDAAAAAALSDVCKNGGKGIMVAPKGYIPNICNAIKHKPLVVTDIFLPPQPGQWNSSQRGRVKLIGSPALFRTLIAKAREGGLTILPTARIESSSKLNNLPSVHLHSTHACSSVFLSGGRNDKMSCQLF